MEHYGEVTKSIRNSEHHLEGFTGSKSWTVGFLYFYFSKSTH